MATSTSGVDAVERTAPLDEPGTWGTLRSLVPVEQSLVGVAKVGIALGLLARPPGPTVPVIVALTVAVYAHNDLTDLVEDGVNRPGRTANVVRRRHAILAVVAVAAVGGLAVAATGGFAAVGLALVPVLLGVCYNSRVVPGPGPDRLKDVLVVNTTVTAAAWAIPVALLPVAFAGTAPGTVAWVACGYLFVRTYVASEFANVPDVRGDDAAGVRTLPVVLGPVWARWVLLGLDGLTGIALALLGVTGVLSPAAALALSPGLVLSAVVLLPRGDAASAGALADLKDAEFALSALALWVVQVL